MDDFGQMLLIFFIGLIILFCIVMVIKLTVTGQPEKNVALEREACVLNYEIKYPEAANNTINRLCELEEMGRQK